jgi:transposase
LDYIPSKLIARHYIRPKYALPNGEGIIIGKLPTRPIEKGIAGAGLLSIRHLQKEQCESVSMAQKGAPSNSRLSS